MKQRTITRTALTAILVLVSLYTMKAQLYFDNDHLFIGTKPTNWQSLGNYPQVFIGPHYGISSFENGLNFFQQTPLLDTVNYRLFLHENDMVGIGRKPVTFALEVKGEVWTTENFLITSDGKIKRNVVSLGDKRNGYLGKLLQLEGKAYEKQISAKDDNSAEYMKEFGFIAQEVKELFPETVAESADGSLAINYIELVPLLLEGVKDLQKKIADLENRIEIISEITNHKN